jgi:hypothetical protein
MKEIYKFKVKDGDKTLEFTFMEASKALSRDGELVYAKTFAQCVREGLLTNAEALKLSNERGGVLSEVEKEDYIKNLGEFIKKEKELAELKEKGEDVKLLEADVSLLKQVVLAYQSRNDSIFELTAETKARDAALLHYALSLVFLDGKPFFEGKDYNSRLKGMETQTSELRNEVLKRGLWYATAIFFGVKNLEEAKYPEDVSVSAS